MGRSRKPLYVFWRTVGSPGRAPVGRILTQATANRSVYHVYILRSESDGQLYTGVTGDLKRRLGEHHRGKVRSTARRRPLVLVYSESFATKPAAMQRERFFKTPEGGARKQRLIEESRSGTVETSPEGCQSG